MVRVVKKVEDLQRLTMTIEAKLSFIEILALVSAAYAVLPTRARTF